MFGVLGFAPIGALFLALMTWVPLHVGAKLFVLPAFAVAIALGCYDRTWGRKALIGFLAGVVATGAYDVLRLGLVWVGMWGDFIPAIGRMALLDHQAHPFWGYLWRYIGNGGGMGMAFPMLHWRGARPGMAYGTAICFCLFGTLLIAPMAPQELFILGPATAAGALGGHIVYGGVLGWLVGSWSKRWAPEPAALEHVVPATPETARVLSPES
jgi:hypothetical protein